mmetsp:Transcript_13411/g.57153  ORF Transcript_13411/g.57153 Transcript_13411/m.57153 type:complete len:229 (-) Transcript_13411:306-992(-)
MPLRNRTPHALHSVLGPSGPLRHSGVFCVRQFAHVTPASGAGAAAFAASALCTASRCASALRTRSFGSKREPTPTPTARAAVGTIGVTFTRLFTGATLTPPGEDARALSSTKEGTLAIGANAFATPPRAYMCRTSMSDGGAALAPATCIDTSASDAPLGRGRPPGSIELLGGLASGAWPAFGCAPAVAIVRVLVAVIRSDGGTLVDRERLWSAATGRRLSRDAAQWEV